MSHQENMVHAWTSTLIVVLSGLTLANAAMLRAGGEEKKIVEVPMEVMRDMMYGYTPEQRVFLVSTLAVLSGLALRVEPPS